MEKVTPITSTTTHGTQTTHGTTMATSGMAKVSEVGSAGLAAKAKAKAKGKVVSCGKEKDKPKEEAVSADLTEKEKEKAPQGFEVSADRRKATVTVNGSAVTVADGTKAMEPPGLPMLGRRSEKQRS